LWRKNELWSIESKAEIISSKIDTIHGGSSNTAELWSIESKAEVISSKCDGISLIPYQVPITQATNPRTPLSSKTISQSGSYFLNENVTGNITITSNNVTLDLNGFTIIGGITLSDSGAAKIIIKNGIVDGNINLGNNNSEIFIEHMVIEHGSISIAGIVKYLTIKDCHITEGGISLSTTATKNNVHISDCVIQATETSGKLSLQNCNHVDIYKTTVQNSSPGSINLFEFNLCKYVSVIHCIAAGSRNSDGFETGLSETVSFE
jgi:hypothetical protein